MAAPPFFCCCRHPQLQFVPLHLRAGTYLIKWVRSIINGLELPRRMPLISFICMVVVLWLFLGWLHVRCQSSEREGKHIWLHALQCGAGWGGMNDKGHAILVLACRLSSQNAEELPPWGVAADPPRLSVPF